MSNLTPCLSLPLLAAGQALKHVTMNEALLSLDALDQLSIESRSVLAQPSAPLDGARYALPAGASGAVWAGLEAGSVLQFRDGAWRAFQPAEGFTAWVRDEGLWIHFSQGHWRRAREVISRNLLVNGGFQIWQRGLLFDNLGGADTPAYVADRWAVAQSGAAANRIEPVMAAGRPRGLRLSRPTGAEETGAIMLFQVVETPPPAGFVTAALDIGFGAGWTGSLMVQLVAGVSADDGSNALATDDWSEQAVIGAVPVGVGETIQTVVVGGVLAADHARLAIRLIWTPAGAAGADAFFEVGRVTLAEGPDAARFETEQPGEVLAACQRFYETSYDTGVAAGSEVTDGRRAHYVLGASFVENCRLSQTFAVRKARAPQVRLYSPSGGAAGFAADEGAANRSITAISVGETGFEILYLDATPAGGIWWHYEADAEL